ncbi:MAG: endopeptidase La [Eubacterium sp.]|nr:endopeptidase La [Eubacterium sp.]
MEYENIIYPVVVFPEQCIFPSTYINLTITDELMLRAVREAVDGGMRKVVLAFVTEPEESLLEAQPELMDVAVIAEIKQYVKGNRGIERALMQTISRVSVESWQTEDDEVIGAKILPFETTRKKGFTEITERAVRMEILDTFKNYIREVATDNQPVYQEIYRKSLEEVVDRLSMVIPMDRETTVSILDEHDLETRAKILDTEIETMIAVFGYRDDFKSSVQRDVENAHKEKFLRMQLNTIMEMLDETSDKNDYETKLQKLDASDEIKDAIREEIDRLESIPSSSSEERVSRDYIETLLSLPWNAKTEDHYDVDKVKKQLDKDHYGLEKVKERIIEFIAVRSLNGGAEAPIICLVGPPGTGKTSIARSVATAINKKYVRIGLGGVRDEAEIRGHRRTYIGAMPGRIIKALKETKVSNPLILLDEIDKVGADYKGDASASLLEVLDPEQNKTFSDHYIELPVDLSEVLFICTANTTDTIDGPLLDRMEVIDLSGYTENEKYHIGKDYLISKQLEKNGLTKKDLSINSKALKDIISYYTRESGVRELDRTISKVCRKAALKRIKDEGKMTVTSKNLEDILGVRKYTNQKANKKADVGIVRGLAWTQVGGDTLEIEVNIMPGDGELIITGQLGDVMKESARIALSYARSISSRDSEFFAKNDIHIHVPEGAVPKDGPSAGVTMTTALYSAIEGIKVDPKVAMTGEVTLRGNVLAIGGLKEKLLAAKMAGIKKVFVPEENIPEVSEIEDEIKEGLEIIYVSDVKTILEGALIR